MEHSKTVGKWLAKPYQTVEKTWQTSLILKKPELTPQVASSFKIFTEASAMVTSSWLRACFSFLGV